MTYIETRTLHQYYFYGTIQSGYGPSMDPHRCGHPDEPCWTITSTREVSDWKVSKIETKGDVPKTVQKRLDKSGVEQTHLPSEDRD